MEIKIPHNIDNLLSHDDSGCFSENTADKSSCPLLLKQCEELIQEVLVSISQLLGVGYCALFLFDPWRLEVHVYFCCAEKPYFKYRKLKTNITNLEKISKGLKISIVVSSNIAKDLLSLIYEGRFSWATCLPICLEDNLLTSALVLGAGIYRTNSQQDELIIANLVRTLRLILEKQSIQKRLDKLSCDFSALVQVGKLMASTLNFETVLAKIVSLLENLLDVESGGFQLYNLETQELALQKPSFGITDEKLIAACHPTLSEGGVAVEVFLRGEPYIINDCNTDTRANRHYCSIYGVRCMLTVPLKVEDRGIGVLHVINKRSGPFSQDDVGLLTLIGSQLAIVIENARLFENVNKHQLEAIALYQVATEISSLMGLDHILNSVVQKLRLLLNSDMTGISLLDQNGNIVMVATAGDYSKNLREVRFIKENDLTAQVIDTKKPVIRCHNQSTEEIYSHDAIGHNAEAEGSNVEVGVPLQNADRVIGVLYVLRRGANVFSVSEVDLLCRFSQQAAIAIENARLYEHEQHNVLKLKEFNHLIETQHDLLKRSVSIHNELTSMVLLDRGIDAITGTLASLLGASVLVTDQFSLLISSASSTIESDSLHIQILAEKEVPREFLNNSKVMGFFKRLAKERRPLVLSVYPELGMSSPLLVAPIVVGHAILGYVSITRPEQKFEELDNVAIEHAATIYALEIMKKKIAVEVENRLKVDYLDDLLSGHYNSDEEIIIRAKFLGYDLTRSYQIIIIDINNFSDYIKIQQGNEKKITKLKGRFYDIIHNLVLERSPQSIVVSKSDKVVIITDVNPTRGLFTESMMPEQLAQMLKHKISKTLTEVTTSIGIGSVTKCLRDFERSYNEANMVLNVLNRFGKKDVIMTFHEIGIYGLLFQIGNKEEMLNYFQRVLGKLLEYDKKNGTFLLVTLESFLQNNCNLQKTSKSAFLHINTLNYRLKRIHEVTGINLNSSEDRLNVQVALKIRELLEIQ